jgi:hypothetical protein
LAISAAIRRASREDYKQKHEAGIIEHGVHKGESHEAFANHRGRFRSYRLHRKTR